MPAGFDMFWIIGAEGIVVGLKKIGESPWRNFLAEQLEHVPWAGFHAYDLIFPLFVFLMGVSTVFSLQRIVEQKGRQAAVMRVLRRGLLLYLLGLFYYGAKSYPDGPEMFRYVGVLQRIAMCYVAGGLLFLFLRARGLIVACVAILLGYWGLMAWVPIPGVAGDRYAEGTNLANYVDQHYLPGYKWDGQWDPEGLLSSLPAVATALLGIFAGMLLVRPNLTDTQRVGALIALGLTCLAIGWVWGYPFPIIKKLWTSSFVLWAGGWSYLLLALFYLIIDVWRFRTWCEPFLWIGMNCITIYLLDNLISFSDLVRRVVHKPWRDYLGNYEP